VREALFSILGDVHGLRVLDLFAGSGALGIEALSRGAESAVFVDDNARAVAVIRRNLEAVGVSAEVHERDAMRFLSAAAGQSYDLVFADPPYDSAGRVAEGLSQGLPPLLAAGARIVTESDKRSPLQLDLPLVLERVYSDTRIAIHGA
jgi:16S rRNA (guanine966-N2)-methyltransferase